MKDFPRGLTTAATAAALVLFAGGGSVAQTALPNTDSHRFIPSTRALDRETDANADTTAATADARAGSTAAEPSSGGPFREAPAAFDNRTNGFDPQGPAFDTLDEDTVVALRSFNDNRFVFEEVEGVADGLGPTFNAQSCRECHQNIVTGGASQIAEHRTGHLTDGTFFESQGGSLIQSRAIHPAIVEHVAIEDDIRTFRISTNTLGAGFIEAVSNATLLAIRDAQPASMRGTAVIVPVLEADGSQRIGRFGWKDQHASLESFAADAYLNEMGITSPLFPEENSSSGVDVSQYDSVPDPEDDGATYCFSQTSCVRLKLRAAVRSRRPR